MHADYSNETEGERQREREEMNRKAGDWNCRCCQHLNFGRRDTCQRCGETRVGAAVCGGGDLLRPAGMMEVKPGDWYCACGVHNFASRQSCFKCGSTKCGFEVDGNAGHVDAPPPLHAVLPPGWKSGDWICPRRDLNI